MHVLCLGDSITRAQVSADYLAILRELVPTARLTRAGVNGDLAWNALQRLDPLLSLKPDAVTVLIGTNDVRAGLGGPAAERLIAVKNPPAPPTRERFAEHLSAIVERVTGQTTARVALLSPTVLGQDPDAPQARRSADYATVVRDVAAEHGVTYLPLHERQLAHLRATAPTCPTYVDTPAYRNRALARHLLLRQSWNTVSRSRGLELTTDFVHQNERGARMIAEEIAGFLS